MTIPKTGLFAAPPVFPRLFFDPGTKATGWAACDARGRLLACGLLRPDKLDVYIHCPGASLSVCVEMPMIYPRAKQKAKPQNIIKLGGFARELGAIAKFHGGSTAKISEVNPHHWKGQLPDLTLYGRIIHALAPAETKVVELGLDKVPDSLAHNTLDAVGIWLHQTGRSVV